MEDYENIGTCVADRKIDAGGGRKTGNSFGVAILTSQTEAILKNQVRTGQRLARA